MPNLPRNRRTKAIKRAGTNQTFYNKNRWRKCSTAYRMAHPVCEVCSALGLIGLATVTDHLVSIECGGQRWHPNNFMAMCEEHHNRKRAYERNHWTPAQSGGLPVDRNEVVIKLATQRVAVDGSQGGVKSLGDFSGTSHA